MDLRSANRYLGIQMLMIDNDSKAYQIQVSFKNFYGVSAITEHWCLRHSLTISFQELSLYETENSKYVSTRRNDWLPNK